MSILLKNAIWPMTLCLNLMKIFGFLVPGKYSERDKRILQFYGIFWYIFINGKGINIIYLQFFLKILKKHYLLVILTKTRDYLINSYILSYNDNLKKNTLSDSLGTK